MQPTSFGLIRHATTRWNEAKRIQGQQDSPLSAAGRTMADSWALVLDQLSWQRILCSDLGRSRETAERINNHLVLPVHADRDLREQDWGTWTGKTLDRVKQEDRPLLKKMVRSGWDFQPPSGESRLAVLSRCRKALYRAHQAWPGERILVVCHEGVVKCLLYHLAQRKFLPEEPKLLKKNHLHLVEQQEDRLSLKALNYQDLNS